MSLDFIKVKKSLVWSICTACGNREKTTKTLLNRGAKCEVCGKDMEYIDKGNELLVRRETKVGKCSRCGAVLRDCNKTLGFCSSIECRAARKALMDYISSKAFDSPLREITVSKIKDLSHGGGYLFSGRCVMESEEVEVESEYVPQER